MGSSPTRRIDYKRVTSFLTTEEALKLLRWFLRHKDWWTKLNNLVKQHHFKGNQYKKFNFLKGKTDEEWAKEVQRLHEENCWGQPKIAKALGISRIVIKRLIREKKVIFQYTKSEMLSKAGKNFRHDEETKKRISESRKAYLREHPEMVPYKLNHYSKGESYPEQYFRKWLEKEGIAFEQEKQISIYSLDFLINNINLEIDGDQHYLDERIVKSNQKRDAYMLEQGIRTIRVRWSSYQSLFRKEQENFLSNLKTDLCA